MRLAGADLVLIHISGKAERLWGKMGSKEKVAQVFNLCNLYVPLLTTYFQDSDFSCG